MEGKKLTIQTTDGCKRLLAIVIAIILVCSCIAQIISTDGGKVKVENITIDSRGATLSADLYYPAGTNDENSLPGLVVAHGAGVTKGNMRGLAEELARRGFVVLNVNGYGTGLSEMPAYDENDMGILDYQTFLTPSGIQDGLNFLRNLEIVDDERVGLVGHSQGAMRVAAAAMNECGYLTFNDIMVNVLYDVFGQTFTEEEIYQDADNLAAARLSDEQLEFYKYIKEVNKADYDTKPVAVCMLGTAANTIGPMATVRVGGHDVLRNCDINKCVILGDYDVFNGAYHTDELIKQSMGITGEISDQDWYILDDQSGVSTIAGNVFNTDVNSNAELKEAIDGRRTWISFFPRETHSRNFFSTETARDVCKYVEQVFGYNGGELGAADAKPVAADNIIFIWREVFNGIAMIAMFGLLIVMAALLCKTKFFGTIVGKNEPEEGVGSKRRFWIGLAISAVGSFIAIYYINTLFAPGLPSFKVTPLFPSWWLTPIYLLILAVISVIQIIVYRAIDKKNGKDGLKAVNLGIGFVNVLKSLLLAIILVFISFLSLTIIKYMFNQDYRFWMTAFEEMKAEQWALVWHFAITMFIQYVILGAALNYKSGVELKPAADTLINIVACSIGVWLCCIINIAVLSSKGIVFSNWTSSYGFLLFVPITVFVMKRMYAATKSVWVGAFLNSLMISWMMISTMGYNLYIEQGFIANFFNI